MTFDEQLSNLLSKSKGVGTVVVELELDPSDGDYLEVIVLDAEDGSPLADVFARPLGPWGEVPPDGLHLTGRDGLVRIPGDAGAHLLVKDGYWPAVVSTTHTPARVTVRLAHGGDLPGLALRVVNPDLTGDTWTGGHIRISRLGPDSESQEFADLLGAEAPESARDLLTLLKRRRALPVVDRGSPWIGKEPTVAWDTVLPGRYVIVARQHEVGVVKRELDVSGTGRHSVELNLVPGPTLLCEVQGAPDGSRISATHETYGLEIACGGPIGEMPNLLPGTYRVRLRVTGGEAVEIGRIAVTAAPPVQRFHCRWDPPEAITVGGRVVLWDFRTNSEVGPAAGVEIRVAGSRNSARTDSGGRFTLSVPGPGRFTLFGHHDLYRPAEAWHLEVPEVGGVDQDTGTYRMVPRE